MKQEAPPATPILGFTPLHAAAEHQLESQFQLIPSPDKAREWHRIFTAEPHPAASDRNNRLADFVADEWRKQGWEDVTLRRYDVLHSRPRSISLEMTAPVHFTASLREDAYDVDADTKNPTVSGSYFGYSASGDITAEVVYAHSGNPEDYDLLRKNGISVKGKMVPHAAKFFPMVRGVRKAIFSGARSLTTILFPAIPPRPAGLLSQAQNTSRRKKRVRFRKSLDFRFRGATPSRFSKT